MTDISQTVVVLRCRARRWIGVAALCALAMQMRMYAQAPKATEYQVMAAYLYNFARFVRRTPRPGA